MIKTDAALERTLKSILVFEQEFDKAKMIDDPVAKKLASSSYKGMLSSLQLEVQRYQSAKK